MDKIDVYIFDNDYLVDIVNKHKEMLFKDIMAKNIETSKAPDGAIVREWEINDKNVKIAIKK